MKPIGFERPDNPEAVRALLFLVTDRQGAGRDLVAWTPQDGRLTTWLNRAWALGEERVLAPRLSPRDQAAGVAHAPGLASVRPACLARASRSMPRVSGTIPVATESRSISLRPLHASRAGAGPRRARVGDRDRMAGSRWSAASCLCSEGGPYWRGPMSSVPSASAGLNLPHDRGSPEAAQDRACWARLPVAGAAGQALRLARWCFSCCRIPRSVVRVQASVSSSTGQPTRRAMPGAALWTTGGTSPLAAGNPSRARAGSRLCGSDRGSTGTRGRWCPLRRRLVSRKTTALVTAGSVWGAAVAVASRRRGGATGNALEVLLALLGTVRIDELGELDAREAGATTYLLVNGQGKGRATKDADASRGPMGA